MIIYLYIKQHNRTGLKYFGVTTRTDPYNYSGSGKYWKWHVKQHGDDVSTIWVQQFSNIEECSAYALNFSKENNIVESTEWANLIEEDGNLYKGIYGFNQHTEETKAKISASMKGRKFTPEAIQKLSAAKLGKRFSETHKQKLSEAHKGKTFTADHRQKLSESRKGMRWFNNGIKNIKAYPNECPAGYVPGMLTHSLQRDIN